jgi:hypothetical protein
MPRLIGILIGSALAVGFLLFTLGRPQLAPAESGAAAPHPPEAIADPMAGVQASDEAPTTAIEAPGAGRETGTGIPDPDSDTAETPDPEPEMAMVEQLFAPEASRTLESPESAPTIVEEHWYAFWSPFRSEIAANGFITKLQESTGIDYRVVKVKTGVYEVAFAYSDDADIETKLERIAAATGLDMSGG